MSVETPLDFQPMRGSKRFYLDIIEKGKSTPYNGRYVIKYLGKNGVHDGFALYGAFSDKLIPNSTIRFNGGIASYESPEASEGSPDFTVDRLYEDKWIPLLRDGTRVDQPSTTGEPSTDGGRRRRRKTKRARRGRRRPSRKA